MSMDKAIKRWADILAPHLYPGVPKAGPLSAHFCVHPGLKPDEPATSATILDASARRAQVEWLSTDIVSSLRGNLTSWLDRDVAAPSQRQFWKLFDIIQKTDDLRSAGPSLFLTDLVHSSIDRTKSDAPFPSAVEMLTRIAAVGIDKLFAVDGQHRSSTIGLMKEALSQRAIREISQRLLTKIDEFSEHSSTSLLNEIRCALRQDIASRIRIKWQYRPVSLPLSASPHTREWVLAFQLRTGTPPPASIDRRPGAGRVPAAFATVSQGLEHGTLRRRSNGRNLLDAVRVASRSASLGEGAQDPAAARGSTRLAGRWHLRPHPTRQERVRTNGCRGGRQMAFDFSLGRRGGAVRNQVRKALTDRSAAA